MQVLSPSIIDSWHAHVYFEASSRELAWALRETIARELADRMEMGRFHEKPVGPHPMWSYQLAFSAANFSAVVAWLALNHGSLDVFVHPNTGDELRDHRDAALWLGQSHRLNLAALAG
ncbi:MAG: DOPA 4,5-dioxygenase family protein [Burkholderiaceae bacterium]